MKKIAILPILLFLTLLTFGQSPQRETYLGGFRLTNVHLTPQNGYLLAGLVKYDSVQIRQYNQAQELERVITLGLRDSTYFVMQVLNAVEVLQMPDGTFILAAPIFECALEKSILLKVDTLGQIIWKKPLDLPTKNLEYNTDSTFLMYSDAESRIFHTNGTDITPNSMPNWSLMTTPLPDGRFLQVEETLVRFTNQWNETLGNAWLPPEAIISMDTLAGNAGFVAFSETKVYTLDNQLQPTGQTNIPVELQGRYIHVCPEGFAALETALNTTYVRTYTPDFTLLSSVILGKDLDFNLLSGFASIVNHVKNSFFVRNGQFTVALKHEDPDDWTKFWLVSDSTGVNRSWLSNTDLSVNDITFSEPPTGNAFPYPSPANPGENLYNVDYKNVFVHVKNEGTTTINHCKIVHFEYNFCFDLQGCERALPNEYTVSLDNLQIAPGEQAVLPIGPMSLFCIPSSQHNFCLHVTEVNHVRDREDDDNYLCRQVPITYVSTKEQIASSFEISPNPAHDWVQIWSKNGINDVEIEQITLISPTGIRLRQVPVTPGDQIQIPVHDLPAGLYFLQVWTTDQKTGIKSFVISR